MGIQSTIRIDRASAEDKFIEMKKDEVEQFWSQRVKGIEDERLEEAIEEEFYNYTIVEKGNE